MRITWVAIIVASLAVAFAPAQDSKQDKAKKDPRFEEIKKLAGDWVMLDEEGKVGKKVTLRYRVTAKGSAVIETLFVGQPEEMVTVYHRDGKDLVMTHYCAARNQPTLKAASKIEKKALSFACESVRNVASHDEGHMHAMTLTFVDDGKLKQAWTFAEKGKMGEEPRFTFVRKKKKE